MDFVTSFNFSLYTVHSLVMIGIFSLQLATIYLASLQYTKTKDPPWLFLILALFVSSFYFFFHALVAPGFFIFNEKLFDIFEHYGLFLGSGIFLVGMVSRIKDTGTLYRLRKRIITGWIIANLLFAASFVFWQRWQNILYSWADYAIGVSGLFFFIIFLFFVWRWYVSRRPIDRYVAAGCFILMGSTITPFFYKEWSLLWWTNHSLFFLGNLMMFVGFVAEKSKMKREDDISYQMPFYLRVKFKLGMMILIFVIVPLFLLGAYGSYIAEQSLRQQALQDLEHLVNADGANIRNFIHLLEITTANFSSDGMVRQLSEDIGLHPETASESAILLNQHLIKNKVPTNQYLMGINVLDAQGEVIASTEDTEIGKDEHEDKYFKEGLQLSYGKTLTMDYGGSSHFGENIPLIVTTAPLFNLDKSHAFGIIVTYFRLDDIALVFSREMKHEETLDVYLINADSLLISESRFLGKNAILSQVIDTKPVQSCRDEQGVSGVWDNWRGEKVYGASTCLTDFSSRWTLVAEIYEAEIIKPAGTFKALIMVATILLAVTAVFIALILASGTVNLLEKLSRFTKKINRGNLDEPMDIDAMDEVGVLAKNLNLMRQTIKMREDDLRKTNNSLTQADQKLKENITNLENVNKAALNLFEDVKKSEEQLKKQADELEKFKQAADKSFDQTIITDADGIILYANHATEIITGYSMQEIIGARPSLWGRQMPLKHYKTLWKTIKVEKQGYAGEFTNKRKDGTKYLASVRIIPILDENNEVKFFVGVTRDITEEREIQLKIVRHTSELEKANVLIEEQKERAESILRFLKSIGEGIFATDIFGKIIFMNETAEVLSKKTLRESELQPANKIFCFAQESESGCAELTFITKALQKKKIITLPDNTVIVHDSQTRIPVSGTCSPIRDAKNQIIGTITVIQDVTQKHELDQMKDSFLSVAAHQLRTPLGSMRWSMELLLSGDFGKLPKSAREAVQQLYDNSQRMVTLVNDLLDISRIEQNRGTEEKKLINLADVVKNALSQMQSEADKRKIKIRMDFPKQSLPNILVSPKHTHEAIENLLSNAIKYNRDRGMVTIKIVQEKKILKLIIADTGIGIPKVDHSKIFSKFFRASNAVLKETEGSGLGLSVVKSYLEESRARVSFESEENVGTTFTIEFPLDPTTGIS